MAGLLPVSSVTEEDLAKSEELKSRANEFFKGITCVLSWLCQVKFCIWRDSVVTRVHLVLG